MPTIEEILRSKGYSDEDLKSMDTLLKDTKFRGAIEGSYGELESNYTKAKGEADQWANWYQETATPTLNKHLKEAADARAEAAQVRERLKFLQEQGLAELAGDQVDPKKVQQVQQQQQQASPEAFDPKKYNLVTEEQIRQYADQEGDAIAMAQDIASEHYQLFGEPLRGFRDLRKEAIQQRKSVHQLWEEKFKVGAKREEIEAKRKADYEAKIRADERSKTISEIGNPMTRPPSTSNNPFVVKRGDSQGKQPWESNPNERAASRVNHALQKVLQ